MPPKKTVAPIVKLERLLGPEKSGFVAICGSTVASDGTLYLVGGLGDNLILKSTTGDTFTELNIQGRGLRGIVVQDRNVWLCGEYGRLFRSPTAFNGLSRIDLETDACLRGMARTDDGAIWAGGDKGFLVRAADGKSFKEIAGVTGDIVRLVVTPLGLLIASDKGLWLANKSKVTKLKLAKSVSHAIVTAAGTIVAVGNGNAIYRSTDRGKTFETVKAPTFTAVKMPGKFANAHWVPKSKSLNVIGELADGRLVVGGTQGVIIASADDGQTFSIVKHKLISNSIWGVATFKGKVYLGGENKIVIRVS